MIIKNFITTYQWGPCWRGFATRSCFELGFTATCRPGGQEYGVYTVGNPDVVWCSMCLQWVLVYTQCFPTQPHTISQTTRPCLTIFHMFSNLDCYWQTWISVAYKPWRSKTIGISFATTRRCHGAIAGVSGVRCSAMFSAFSAFSVVGGGMQNSEPNWYKTHFTYM